MVDIEIKMRNAFKLSDLLYFRERDKILFDLEKDLPRISRESQLSGGLNSSMHVNNILDRRLDAIKQLVNFRIKLDAQKIDETVDIITVKISEKIFERAKQLIKDQMGNFCRRFPGSDSYLDLINSRVKDEKNKLIIYAEREVNIFQKQSESKIQGKKVFNEMSVTEKEIKLSISDAWDKIKKDFDISKYAFSRKINFVKDPFKKRIIFRDIGQAYLLAEKDFSKPAVILAGSVIEELLRLYLKFKNIKPSKNNFDEYIKSCENNRLFKKGISQLSHSLRNFRNIVHLENEVSGKYTISKATAKGAISSIFTISNDF